MADSPKGYSVLFFIFVWAFLISSEMVNYLVRSYQPVNSSLESYLRLLISRPDILFIFAILILFISFFYQYFVVPKQNDLIFFFMKAGLILGIISLSAAILSSSLENCLQSAISRPDTLFMLVISILIISFFYQFFIEPKQNGKLFLLMRFAFLFGIILLSAAILSVFISSLKLINNSIDLIAQPYNLTQFIVMALGSIFFLILISVIILLLLYFSKRPFFSPLRYTILLLCTCLGKAYRWLNESWRILLVRLFDVIVIATIVDFFLVSTNIKGGNISTINQIILKASSNDVYHWEVILAAWIIFELLRQMVDSSKNLRIEEVNGSNIKPKSKADSKDAEAASETISPAQGLGNLLMVKLNRIGEVYQSVDEQRSIKSEGLGRPIEATMKVEDFNEFVTDSDSKISLGPVTIPTNYLPKLVSRLLKGPVMTLSLHSKEDNEKRIRFFLTASLSGKLGSRSWIIDSPVSIEKIGDNNMENRGRTIEDMITELAHRAFSEINFNQSGKLMPWKASYYFNCGLRAYRDCLHTAKKRKYYLSKAEKKLVKAVEEDADFSIAFYNLGVVYTELEQLDSAEEAFKKAIKSNPNDWESYYALGLILFKKMEKREKLCPSLAPHYDHIIDRYDEVLHLCEHVIYLRKGSILHGNYGNLARTYDLMGDSRICQERLIRQKRLIHQAERDRKTVPDYSCSPFQDELDFSNISSSKADEIKAKETKLNDAIKYLKDSVDCAWKEFLLSTLWNSDATNAAKAVAECSMDLARAYSFKDLHKTKKAENILLQAIYINPNRSELYRYLGTIYLNNYDESKAKKYYELALEIDPGDSESKARLAVIEAKSKHEIEKAMTICEEVECCGPNVSNKALNVINKAFALSYVFSWREKHNGRLMEFLEKNFNIDGGSDASIEEIGDKIIKVTAKKDIVLLKLNDKETKVLLEINDTKMDALEVIRENEKLNIFGSSNNLLTTCEIVGVSNFIKHAELLARLKWYEKEGESALGCLLKERARAENERSWRDHAEICLALNRLQKRLKLEIERDCCYWINLSKGKLKELCEEDQKNRKTPFKADQMCMVEASSNSQTLSYLYLELVEFLFESSTTFDGEVYSFSWDEIPGNDNVRLMKFLTQEFRIESDNNAKIEKNDDGRTIKVSAKKESLSLKREDKNAEVILEIDYHSTNKFIAKMEDRTLNINGDMYVFSWDEIPGNDNIRLMKFLTQEFRIECFNNAKIEKIDDGKTIKVSAENKSLSLKREDKNAEVILEIDYRSTNKFIAKMKDRTLNIYGDVSKIKKCFRYFDRARKNCDNAKSMIYERREHASSCKQSSSPKKHCSSFCQRMQSLQLIEIGKIYLDINRKYRDWQNKPKNSEKFASFTRISNEFECADKAEKIFKDAIETLEKVNVDDIKHSKVRVFLAQSLMMQKGKQYKALMQAQKARNLNPLDNVEHEKLGEIYCHLKEFAYGIDELENSISWKPDDPEILLEIGKEYMKAAMDCKTREKRKMALERAVEYLKESLEIRDRPDVVERGNTRYWLGKAYLEMGTYDQAIPHLRILSEIGKDELPVRLSLGYAYLKSHDYARCEILLQEIIEECVDGSDEVVGDRYEDLMTKNEIRVRAILFKALSLAKRDTKLAEAMNLAKEAIPLIKNMEDGTLKEREKVRKIKAFRIEEREKALKIRALNALLAECLGMISLKKGKVDAAIHILKFSLSLNPTPTAYLELAKAYDQKVQNKKLCLSEKTLLIDKILTLCDLSRKINFADEVEKDIKNIEKHYSEKIADA